MLRGILMVSCRSRERCLSECWCWSMLSLPTRKWEGGKSHSPKFVREIWSREEGGNCSCRYRSGFLSTLRFPAFLFARPFDRKSRELDHEFPQAYRLACQLPWSNLFGESLQFVCGVFGRARACWSLLFESVLTSGPWAGLGRKRYHRTNAS